MQTLATPCALCGHTEGFTVLYQANFNESDLNAEVFSARRMPDRKHYQIVRCLQDGLVRSNPILPEEEAAKLYKKSKFSYTDEVANLTVTYMAALENVLARLPKDAKILEIGCGNGFILEALVKRGFTNVTGVEPGLDAVNKAAPEIRGQIKNEMFKKGLLSENQFDLVFFFQTLDHIHHPNEFIQECARVLKTGGYVLAFQHDVEHWTARLLGERSPIIDIEHIYLFSPRTLKAIFEKHGFQALKVYSPANQLSLKHLLWLMPLSQNSKNRIFASKKAWVQNLLKKRIKLKLGNLCLIAQKRAV